MRVLVAIAVLSVGCSKKEQAKPVEAPPKPAEPAPTPADPPRTGTLEALAATLGAKIAAQGTAELDDKPGPDRWAQLTMRDGEHGAYVVETSGKAFLAQYDADGRTQPWDGGAGDTAISHQQGHRAGYERWDLAVRGGELVVLREESIDDARDDDQPKHTDYADPSGVCAKPCPKAGEKGFSVTSGSSLADLTAAPKP